MRVRFHWVEIRGAIAIASAALVGCGFHGAAAHSIDSGSDTSSDTPDAPGTGTDAAPATTCYGPLAPSPWRVCLGAIPLGTVTLAAEINTDDDPSCLQAQPAGWSGPQAPACFVVGHAISIATTTVFGRRPLVLVAAQSITIGALLDIASHREHKTGPATQAASCQGFAQDPGSSDNDGGGGGAGGSFQSRGGNGGSGGQGSANRGQSANADGGPPVALRGGCRGQRGAQSDGDLAAPSAAGDGGGAAYLVAGDTISVIGAINASGAAGSGGAKAQGGSGAGSGGMIVLYAGQAIAATRVMANGGGGGGGGSKDSSGSSGFEPAVGAVPANGGSGAAGNGGDGGQGFPATGDALNGGEGKAGGGGGGGGAGVILASPAIAGTGISPPPTPFP